MPKNNTTNHHKKQFDAWNKVKKNINRRAKVPTIHEGEIWWFADGQNVGVEIDGKGNNFARPVLILTKFGNLSFAGVPLTSKEHIGPWYADFIFRNKRQYAALNQVKTVSVYRLYQKIGEIPHSDQARVRTAFLKLHNKKYPLSSDRGIVGIPKDNSIINHILNKIKTFLKL